MEKELVNQEAQEGISLRELFAIIKRNIWIILAVVVLFGAVGIVYSYMKKPTYTATEKVVFVCKNENNNADTTQNNVSTMIAYVDTIVDFCDEDVVLDRANYYYIQYKNGDYENVEEYIEYLKTQSDDGYDVENPSAESYYASQSVGIKTVVNDANSMQFTFAINYTDANKQASEDKIKILVYAFSKEVLSKDSSGEFIYFGKFAVNVTDMGNMSVVTNTSKTKTVLLFGAIGVVAAGLLVCVKTLLDNTIKTKDEIERITGVSLFAAIENKE